MWKNDETMIGWGKPKRLREKPAPCHFAHHRSHMKSHRTESEIE
jgi:hypothetical protein